MLLRQLLPWSWALSSLFFVLFVAPDSALTNEPPRKSNGLTDVVQWDTYTLFLHDLRMFL